MAKAGSKPKLLERIVTSPKGIHCHDKKGNRIHAKQGDTVYVQVHTAKTFAHMLEDPKVAAAKAAAAEAEAEAEAEANAEAESDPSEDAGGDSGGS